MLLITATYIPFLFMTHNSTLKWKSSTSSSSCSCATSSAILHSRLSAHSIQDSLKTMESLKISLATYSVPILLDSFLRASFWVKSSITYPFVYLIGQQILPYEHRHPRVRFCARLFRNPLLHEGQDYDHHLFNHRQAFRWLCKLPSIC